MGKVLSLFGFRDQPEPEPEPEPEPFDYHDAMYHLEVLCHEILNAEGLTETKILVDELHRMVEVWPDG